MLELEFGALGGKLSALCLGSMNFGDTMDEATSFAVMDEFAAMGGNFIDTARVYGAFGPNGEGASERVIGNWMKSRGMAGKIKVATKGGHPPLNDMHKGRLDRKSLESDLNKSLDALKTDKIDLYWLHRDDVSLDVSEILLTLNDFIKEGKISAFGASNWTADRLKRAQSAASQLGIRGFSANQPMWSLAKNTLIEDDTLVQMDVSSYAWHRESHMPCVAYTSQAKGFFPKLADIGADNLPEKAKKRYYNEHNLAIFEALKDICSREGVSMSAAGIMFLTGQRDFSAFPIVGVSSVEQAKQLRSAADARFSNDDMNRLLALTGLMEDGYDN